MKKKIHRISVEKKTTLHVDMDEKKNNKDRSNWTTMNASEAFANRQYMGNTRCSPLMEGLEEVKQEDKWCLSKKWSIATIVMIAVIVLLMIAYILYIRNLLKKDKAN